MQFKNTRETVGTVVEVSTSLKTSNGRAVQVKLTREDRALLDHIEQLQQDSYGAVNSFSPSLKLKVEITSDTFRGGLVGKLINLKEVHQVWVKAHKNWIKGGI